MESKSPKVLEPYAEWRRSNVEDPDVWTERLTAEDLRELDDALQYAKRKSTNVLELDKGDFPLPHLAPRLRRVENELINGRGFVLIRGLPRDQYDKDDASLLYWGIGMHLGRPWPQNKKGHVLGDVTDQGKTAG